MTFLPLVGLFFCRSDLAERLGCCHGDGVAPGVAVARVTLSAGEQHPGRHAGLQHLVQGTRHHRAQQRGEHPALAMTDNSHPDAFNTSAHGPTLSQTRSKFFFFKKHQVGIPLSLKLQQSSYSFSAKGVQYFSRKRPYPNLLEPLTSYQDSAFSVFEAGRAQK